MFQRFTDSDIQKLGKRYKTNLINSISGFKSLQLVGTLSENGEPNLAVFNSIFHLGANPPLIGMVIRPEGNDHSTLKNIIATEFYTLNNVTESFYKQAHQTSARYLSGESEFEKCNLNEHYVGDFKAPFVAQSSIKIGLALRQLLPVELNGTTIVIGEIQLIEIDDSLLAEDGFIDLSMAGSLTVAGLDAYYSTSPLSRLTYAKPGTEPQELPKIIQH